MEDRTTIADLERRLAESETRHRRLINSWAQLSWETDGDGVVVADSPSWRAYTGQTLEEWLGYGWLDAIHPEDRAFAERQWREATEARGLVDAEFRLRTPNGGWRWTNVRAAPVLDESGKIENWAGINIDIDARKHAELALRESEELRRIAIRAGRMGTWRWNLRDELIWGDAAFLELWGFPPSDQARRLTDFTDRMSPQGRAEIGELVPRAIAAGEEFDGQLAVVGGPSSGRWVRWRGQVERERPWIVNGVSFDVTEQRTAEDRLRASEEELRHTVELNPQITWTATPDGRMDTSSERWATWTGSHGLGEEWHEVQHPDDFPTMYETWMHSVRTGEPVDVEHRTRIAGEGSYRWMRSRAYPRLDASGAIIKWYGITEDIHEGKLAAQALRESEARFAQFAASSSDALWMRDAVTLAMEYTSPAIEAIYGIGPDVIQGTVERWTALIVEEDRDAARANLERVRDGEAIVHEFRIRRPSDGETRWIRNTDFPLRDEHGRMRRVGGIAEDFTEAKRAADRQKVLVNELQHRARNLLGVVAAVAGRTLRQGSSVEAFEERLQALSRAQGLLSQFGSDTVAVLALVQAELAAHADGVADRIHVAGPEVHLTARQVQNFALALHELTTNAVKYGALRKGTGHLAVTWELLPQRRGRRYLALSWIESGVSIDLATVTRSGYGTELIREALAYALQAKVEYALGEGGVRCRIEMPIT